jgi:hypothetical protein
MPLREEGRHHADLLVVLLLSRVDGPTSASAQLLLETGVLHGAVVLVVWREEGCCLVATRATTLRKRLGESNGQSLLV